LKCDANTEIRDVNGDTVLHQASSHWYLRDGQRDAVKILLKGGADIESRSLDGKTALHLACEGGYDDLVCLFLEECRARAGEDWTSRCDAFVNTRSGDGSTALHYAHRYCSKTTIKLLVSYRADMYARDKEGRTPGSVEPF